MKTSKKAVSIILAAALCTAAVACSGNSSSDDAEDVKASTVEQLYSGSLCVANAKSRSDMTFNSAVGVMVGEETEGYARVVTSGSAMDGSFFIDIDFSGGNYDVISICAEDVTASDYVCMVAATGDAEYTPISFMSAGNVSVGDGVYVVGLDAIGACTVCDGEITEKDELGALEVKYEGEDGFAAGLIADKKGNAIALVCSETASGCKAVPKTHFENGLTGAGFYTPFNYYHKTGKVYLTSATITDYFTVTLSAPLIIGDTLYHDVTLNKKAAFDTSKLVGSTLKISGSFDTTVYYQRGSLSYLYSYIYFMSFDFYILPTTVYPYTQVVSKYMGLSNCTVISKITGTPTYYTTGYLEMDEGKR